MFAGYSGGYILVTGDIAAAAGNVAFKNCTPFSTCKRETNVLVVEANHIYIAMLCTIWLNIAIIVQIHLEIYSSLKEMKLLLIINNSQSFKYKATLLDK